LFIFYVAIEIVDVWQKCPRIRTGGVIADQTIALDGTRSRQDYPVQLRRIRCKDPETGKRLVFLTNQTTLPASTICDLYKSRWKVELFFKWIKQHLRIKRFYGTSENAVKTQIWVAVSMYVLVAIARKRLQGLAGIRSWCRPRRRRAIGTQPCDRRSQNATNCFTSGCVPKLRQMMNDGRGRLAGGMGG
jgi:hypothetical protein